MIQRKIANPPDFAQKATRCQPAGGRLPGVLLSMALACFAACGEGSDGASDDAAADDAMAQRTAALLRPRPPTLSSSQTLTELATLTPNLCSSVVMDGNTAVFNQSLVFSVVVMTYSGGRWKTQATLTPALPGYTAGFPYCLSMALSGDTLVLGVSMMYGAGSSYFTPQGAVFVFRRSGSTWTQEQALVGFGSAGLGWRVAVSGDLLVAVTQKDDFLLTYRRTAGVWTQLPAGSLVLRSRPSEIALAGKRMAIADGNESARVYETDGTRWILSDDLAGPVGYTSASTQLQADQLAVMWAGPSRPSSPRHSFVQLYQATAGRFAATQRLEHPQYPDEDHLGWRLTLDRDWLVTHDSEKGYSFVYQHSAGSWLPSWTIVGSTAHMAVRGAQVVRGQDRYGGRVFPVPQAFTLP